MTDFCEHVSPELRHMALADLGQKVLNAVTTTNQLGHTRLQHSLIYVHSAGNVAVDLTKAVIKGEIDAAMAAARAWGAGAPAQVCEQYGLDPAVHIRRIPRSECPDHNQDA